MEQTIAKENYYHGLLPREDIKMMLKEHGDFVLRVSEPKSGDERHVILSIMVYEDKEENGIKHYIIRKFGAKVVVEKLAFTSIQELVTHHMTKKEPVSSKDPESILKTPILRQPWELYHEDVEPTKKLGEGAYGEVHMGNLKLKSGLKLKVAIKLAKLATLNKDQIKEIMHEARLMRSFDHLNVVKFYGVAAGMEPLMVVMEFVDGGALDSFLKKETDPKHKAEMCAQASFGIEYLHSRNCIHRDIAARNCLYGSGQVKISDFGLTCEGTTFQMDPHKRVPIRWLAPEVLRTSMYSQKTDVWAFGILAWEIYSNGIEPYPNMAVADVVQALRTGFRMERPLTCPEDFYAFIRHCIWAERDVERPSMNIIVGYMEKMTGLRQPQSAKSTTEITQRSKKKVNPLGLAKAITK